MTTTMTTLNAAERSLRSKMANAHGKTWEQEILTLCDSELLQMQHVPPACTIISAAPPRKNGYSDPRLRIVRLERSRSVDFEGFLPLASGGGVPLAIEAKASILEGDNRSWPLPDRLRLDKGAEFGQQGRKLVNSTMMNTLGFVLLRLTVRKATPAGLREAEHVFLVPGLHHLLIQPSWSRETLLPFRVPTDKTWLDVIDEKYLPRLGVVRLRSTDDLVEENDSIYQDDIELTRK